MARVRFLGVADVLNITSFSESTLWRKVKAGIFPKPVSLSERRVGWRESEILTWADQLESADGTKADEFTRVARRLAEGTLKGQIILGQPRRVRILRTDERVVIERREPNQ